jgi:protein-disulfide isomerase
MKNKGLVLGSVVFLFIAFIGGVIFYKKSEESKLESMAGKGNEAPFVREHSPKFGKNQNDVTVVEFLDPECESCKTFHPAVKKVLSEYNDEISLVVRYIPNHKNSRYVIKILEAAKKQGKYKEALDVIFENQHIWGNSKSPKPQLIWGYMPSVGLDIAKLRKDFEDKEILSNLNIDINDAKVLGVRGTPTIFVNGKKLEKLSYQALLDMVEVQIYK